MQVLTRRLFLLASSAVALSACQTRRPPRLEDELVRLRGAAAAPAAPPPPPPPAAPADPRPEDYAAMYGPVENEPFPIPGVPPGTVNPAFLRRAVPYAGPEEPGTIVVDPARRYLYLVQPGGRAIRYGVGVGREGFGWSGVATVNSKQAWPDWYPPKEMIARQPELQRVVTSLPGGKGVPGGLRNPLGARALYLWQNGRDTLFRIHGTNEPHTIGARVSSGCIRMINQDVIDLYDRTPVGAKVVVLPGPGHARPAAEPAPQRPARRRGGGA
ncbi:L,D-transpeptidase [Camelimonas abortus]|uniref:L,D-transpeptidase n=1 Tax=Camelimonas abortus TaxID=1017184 RepID=A0ABV7LF82_9HYPH